MHLRFSRRASAELAEIHAYIAARNPAAADRLTDRMLQSIDVLRDFPMIGRAGRLPGTRELVFPGLSYFAAYRVRGELVEIVTIVHTSRDWP